MNNFSVIIPIYNESENLKKLISEIKKSLVEKDNYEIIIINDGSTDETKKCISELKEDFSINYIEHNKNIGQSNSILTGINNSLYNTIVTLDGDGQNNPNDIPKLLDIFFSNDYSLVSGIRKIRKDSFVKIFSSKIANFIRSMILKDDCPDTGCSLKVFDKRVFMNFPFFDGIHRFLPALYKGFGYKTFNVGVDHRARVKGKSNYGTLDRLFKGLIDLYKVYFILRRYNK